MSQDQPVTGAAGATRATGVLLHRVQGRSLELAFEIPPGAIPQWRYFGPAAAGAQGAAPDGVLAHAAGPWPQQAGRPLPPATLDGDPPLSVLPVHGFGWFGQPALAGGRPASGIKAHMAHTAHIAQASATAVPSTMPLDVDGGDRDWSQGFQLDDLQQPDPGCLRVRLVDSCAGLAVTLSYSFAARSDVLVAWADVENLEPAPFRLDWLAALTWPVPAEAKQLICFGGRWTLEFQQAREQLGVGTWRRDNRRGRTSHDSFPGLIVGQSLDEDAAAVFGAHLGWSGNHTLLIEPLTDGRRQAQLGEWLAPGEVVLAGGEHYRSPPAYLSFSALGLNGLSANFHDHLRRHVLAWPGGTMAPRPVHLNTWEAVYFDHDLDGLKELASAAAQLGVERFVLDDGWFHRRDNDRAALGDWWPDARKYPDGLAPLIDHVSGLGMQFGLWVEPEMVNPDSDLYRAHPDWALQLDGRAAVTGRNQLVLDLGQAAVSGYLFDRLDQLLRAGSIGYLKWDMNRDLAGAGHHGVAAYRRQTLALYALMARLRSAHPQVEIESCASGGGRADYGVLAHTHRIWTSDCNDALTRIDIQRGFLRFFPPELMGAHVGPALSQTTGRCHPLAFRAAVALFGHFGLELDLRTLRAAERAELASWIAVYKEWRHVLHAGTLRQHGGDGPIFGLQATAADRSAALCAVYRRCEDGARYQQPLRLDDLDPLRNYRLRALRVPTTPHGRGQTALLQALADGTLVLSGAALGRYGLPLPPLPPESALVVELRPV